MNKIQEKITKDNIDEMCQEKPFSNLVELAGSQEVVTEAIFDSLNKDIDIVVESIVSPEEVCEAIKKIQTIKKIQNKWSNNCYVQYYPISILNELYDNRYYDTTITLSKEIITNIIKRASSKVQEKIFDDTKRRCVEEYVQTDMENLIDNFKKYEVANIEVSLKIEEPLYCTISLQYGDEVYNNGFYSITNLMATKDEPQKTETAVKNSILGWLIYQQGYIMEDVHGDKNTDFLCSVRHEIKNITTQTSALSFCVRFDSLDEMENFLLNTEKNILFPKGTTCGLYDFFNKDGSCFEIILEKDVIIPGMGEKSMIAQIEIENDNKNDTVKKSIWFKLSKKDWNNKIQYTDKEVFSLDCAIENCHKITTRKIKM